VATFRPRSVEQNATMSSNADSFQPLTRFLGS
jgi:hypothetical protein